MNILLVEDEPKIAAFIRKGLEEQSYNVEQAFDGKTGKKLALEKKYDLIILDVILPELGGLDVCREIRKQNEMVPILMLTALGSIEDKITGLDCGADDYLIKPFHFKEFLARVRALTRKKIGTKDHIILRFADIEMDTTSKSVTRNNIKIRLTAKEYELLEFFIRNPNVMHNRADISSKVWGINFDTGTNIIDVYVNYLRNKVEKGFEKKLIHTAVGMGYIMKIED